MLSNQLTPMYLPGDR